VADTRNTIRLTGEDWEDVSDLTGIASGTAIYLQSQSSMYIQIAVSPTKPDKTFKGMFLPNSPSYLTNVTSGENKVWLYGVGPVSVQEA
jgi:hypothetical protein